MNIDGMHNIKISIFNCVVVINYFVSFVSLVYIKNYDLFKYLGIVLVGLYLVIHIKQVIKKEYLIIDFLCILFCFIMIVSGYVNKDYYVMRNPFYASIIMGIIILENLCLMQLAAYKKKAYSVINIYIKCSLLCLIVNDFLMLFTSYGRLLSGYFLGTKFQVSYLHIELVLFFVLKYFLSRDKFIKLMIYFSIMLSVLISIFVGCNTGIICCLIYVLCMLLFKKSNNYCNKYLLIVAIITVLPLGIKEIIQNSYVKYLVVNVLNRDITLTGRTMIYSVVPQLMQRKLALGYGYATSYEIGALNGGFPDTQNCIWEWIWNMGVFGTIILVIYIYSILRKCNSNSNDAYKKMCRSIVMMVFTFTLIGSIEITYTKDFFCILALILCFDGIKDNYSTNIQ